MNWLKAARVFPLLRSLYRGNRSVSKCDWARTMVISVVAVSLESFQRARRLFRIQSGGFLLYWRCQIHSQTTRYSAAILFVRRVSLLGMRVCALETGFSQATSWYGGDARQYKVDSRSAVRAGLTSKSRGTH